MYAEIILRQVLVPYCKKGAHLHIDWSTAVDWRARCDHCDGTTGYAGLQFRNMVKSEALVTESSLSCIMRSKVYTNWPLTLGGSVAGAMTHECGRGDATVTGVRVGPRSSWAGWDEREYSGSDTAWWGAETAPFYALSRAQPSSRREMDDPRDS
jgi:hypothetical protein